ncbi:MAG TPA: LysE family translocator [Methylomirabilota bacterium]
MNLLDPELVAFTVVATIVTVLPGADMALVARSVLTRGRRAGYVTTLGICTGLWVHALASGIGLSAILVASATLFSVVKFLGALYLVALGLTSLLGALRGRAGAAPATIATARDARRAFLQGLLSNVLNPKVALFYLTLLPQFVRPGDSLLVRSLLLAGIHVVIGLAWLFLYTYFLGRLDVVLRRPRVRNLLEGITGTVLVGLGARVAWDRR